MKWMNHRVAFLACTALLVLGLAATSAEDKKDKAEEKDKEPDILYVPTPQVVVDKMLEVCKIGKDDVVYDLGCGDGRIVCTAAKKYKCKAKGFDVDSKRIKDSEDTRSKLDKDIQKLVTFEKKDVFTLDLSDATVITVYLLPSLNVKLIPQLKKLKKGARIVSHDFDMKGVTPDKGYPIEVEGPNRTHKVYKWSVPLALEKE
jgi:hypothetical protein